jgi:hypothetical protein
MTHKPEKQLIEDYLVKELEEKGWGFVDAKNLKRPSLREAIIEDNFRLALTSI